MSADRRPGDEAAAARPLRSDLEAGKGSSDDRYAVPAEEVLELAGIEPPGVQDGVAEGDGIDRLGSMTDTRIYEGDLEARPPDSDQPDEPDAENLESLTATELRAGETDNPDEAAEEGLAWVPPSDPPVVPGDLGQPRIAAGFGTTADDEPFDADHHQGLLPEDDERSERVHEALRAHAATAGLADRLQVETIGSRAIIAGVVDDLADEDEVVAVAAEVEGISAVESRIEVAGLG